MENFFSIFSSVSQNYLVFILSRLIDSSIDNKSNNKMIDNKNVSIKEKKKKIIISAGMVFVIVYLRDC